MKPCRVAIESEGPAVFLALKQERTSATLRLTRRGAAVVAANLLLATNADEDAELECELRAELTTDQDTP